MRRLMLMLAVVATSCGVHKALPLESNKDSVSVVVKERVIYRDSLIYVEVPAEAESSVLSDTDTSRLETSLALSEAWVSNGNLNHTLQHKPDMRLPKIISIPVYLKSEKTEHLSSKVEVKEIVTEKQLNHWQIFRMTLGTIALAIIGLFLVFKIIKLLL